LQATAGVKDMGPRPQVYVGHVPKALGRR
jgi:hypothetical protein